MKTFTLNGNTLDTKTIGAIVGDSSGMVRIAPDALERVRQAKKFLDKEFDKKIIYGVNTGFGPMASHIIGREDVIALQLNLIRGHAMGMGAPIPSTYVLAAMIVRLNTLAKGLSGVSPELLKQLELFINKRIIPIVPEHGAVGTSGDLVQLAHIALALIGEGDVFYKGKREPAAHVLKRLHIAPYSLKPKEGLSLINGTSMMTGITAILAENAKQLISFSVRLGALALELTGGFDDSISKELHAARPHPGQQEVAEALRGLLASSRLLRQREKFQKRFNVAAELHVIPESVQEVYSLRCIAQVVGPVLDIFKKTLRETNTEINAVTDNPIIDLKSRRFLHGGNFHGDYIAAAVDQMKISLVKLTMLSERRTNFFLNRNINAMFPPFMNLKTPGLTMGLQGLQFVATSTTAQSQSLAFPHHIHSIPTNGDNQDIVSMGTDAALIAAKVIENACIVLSIEALALAQGIAFTKQKAKLSVASKELVEAVNAAVRPVQDDRSLSGELPKLVAMIGRYELVKLPW